MNNAERMVEMRARLSAALGARDIEIVDESHLHVGHAGARDGRGHFSVRVVSESFEGLAPLARHRAVYAALGDLMTTDIHALRIMAVEPPARAQGK